MPIREPTPLRSLLPKVLAQLATDTGEGGHLAMIWGIAVGPVIARHARPVTFRNGTVVIMVSSARWKAELEQRERELRCRFLEHLSGVRVARLQFRLEACQS